MSKEIKNIAENKNFKAVCVGPWAEIAQFVTGNFKGKVFVKDALATTGSEISFGALPANTPLPFFHAHKQNEEVYLVLKGSGKMQIDGDVLELQEGTLVRVDPQGARSLKSGPDGMLFMCIQTKSNSLGQWTSTDGVPVQMESKL